MSPKSRHATVTFTGVKPLLFDRYGGSNEVKLEPVDKVYWHEEICVMPAINLYSALTAENTKSVAKMYFGKRAKPVGMAIQTGLRVEENNIPITVQGTTIPMDAFDEFFEIVEHVARINKSGTAVPNPKVRPMLDTPWEMKFDIEFHPHGDVTWEVMQQCLGHCGVIGLGTYRPLYGGFGVEIEEKD